MSEQVVRTRIICSQCGEQGHNKRNRNCPVNVELRRRADQENEEMRKSMESLRSAENTNNMLTDLFRRWQGVIPLNECLTGAVILVEYICHYFRIAKRHYVPSSLLESIKENVNKLNRLLMIHQEPNPLAVYSLGIIVLELREEGPFPAYRAVYELSPVGPRIPLRNMTNDIIAEMIKPSQLVRRSRDYWKEIMISFLSSKQEQKSNPDLDLDLDHDCPVCFDSLQTKQIVQTNCGHGYCRECVKNIASSMKDKTQQPSCPLCRTTLRELKSYDQQICTEIQVHILNL